MRRAAAFRHRRLGKIGGLLDGDYDSRTLAKYLTKGLLHLSISRPLVRRVSRAKVSANRGGAEARPKIPSQEEIGLCDS